MSFKMLMYLLLLAWVFSPSPANATVDVSGRVELWDPLLGEYQPLRGITVRIDFKAFWQVGHCPSESDDSELCASGWTDFFHEDQETITNHTGHYTFSKPNATGMYQRHQAKLIVLAQEAGRVEVKAGLLPADPYSFETAWHTALNDSNTTIDVRIGGDRETDGLGYHVNGSWLPRLPPDNIDRTRGVSAFYALKCVLDHREELIETGQFALDDFQYKLIWFPNPFDASFYAPLELIFLEQEFFDEENELTFESGCYVARHEASHGLMADLYLPVLNPAATGALEGQVPGPHMLHTEWPTQSLAFSEAWAEFLASVTMHRQYTVLPHDLENINGPWQNLVTSGQDNSRVEGQVAAVLWDIYDGWGEWEDRRETPRDLSEHQMFFDGLADGDLEQIVGVVRRFQPQALSHATAPPYIGSALGGNFVKRWVNNTNNNQHFLKAILYNRGITVPEFVQSAPTLVLGQLALDGLKFSIPVTVTEIEQEDRRFVQLELFVGDDYLVQRLPSQRGAELVPSAARLNQWRIDDWRGDTLTTTVRYGFPTSWSGRRVKVGLTAHDNMQASYESWNIQVPRNYPVPKAVVGCIKHISVPGFPASRSSGARLSLDITAKVHHLEEERSVSINLGTLGSGGTLFDGQRRFVTSDSNALFVNVEFVLTASFPGVFESKPERVSRTVTHFAEDNYGVGRHRLILEGPASSSLPQDFEVQIEYEMDDTGQRCFSRT